MKVQQVLLTGASGMIGSSLERLLHAKSIHVTKLIRREPRPGEQAIRWDPGPGTTGQLQPGPFPLAGPTQLDAAVHLSGANVAGRRWTPSYKKEIFDSRVDSTRALSRMLASRTQKPEVLVCASAIGIYGDCGGTVVDESSPAGEGFLADTCQAWEAATREAEDAGIRVVHARFGVVLAREGGALAKLLPLFRLGLGGKLGSGKQWMSWVTLRDAVQAVLRAVEDTSLRGAVNVTSPGPVTNEDFTRTFGRVLGRPAAMAVPAFALRLAVGSMADEGLLASCRAVPSRLAQSGFEFEDPRLEPALRLLLG